MLSPSVCDFSVADLSDLPRGRAVFTLPLLVFSSVDFYSACIPKGSINSLQKNSFVQDTRLDPGGNLEMSKRALLPARSLQSRKKKKSKISDLGSCRSVGIQRTERLRRSEGGFVMKAEFEIEIMAD